VRAALVQQLGECKSVRVLQEACGLFGAFGRAEGRTEGRTRTLAA